MGKANYLALVGGGRQPKFAQNKVILWDDAKSKVALEITTLTAVRGVQLGRDRIVVVLQNSVRVYKFAKPPDLIAAYETADNLLGLCCMSDKHIAFPGRTTGQVQLVEIATGNVSIIPAHSSALKAIQISPDGELLATASETVRVSSFFLALPLPVFCFTLPSSSLTDPGYTYTGLRHEQLRTSCRAEERNRSLDHLLARIQPIWYHAGLHIRQVHAAHI